jgi:hypothetical protein
VCFVLAACLPRVTSYITQIGFLPVTVEAFCQMHEFFVDIYVAMENQYGDQVKVY